jgi:2-C-methyl-D-erythritol 4-phosphate cytidylyltransferase
VHPDDVAGLADSELGRRLRDSGITAVVAGGATRTASALAGVEATSPDAVDVLVHDAARPFVAAERVRALIDALATAESALLAVPSTSTVKRADDAGRVAETLDRRRIHLATTPQGALTFDPPYARLREAVACGKDGTDEASLLEAAGFIPRSSKTLRPY